MLTRYKEKNKSGKNLEEKESWLITKKIKNLERREARSSTSDSTVYETVFSMYTYTPNLFWLCFNKQYCILQFVSGYGIVQIETKLNEVTAYIPSDIYLSTSLYFFHDLKINFNIILIKSNQNINNENK